MNTPNESSALTDFVTIERTREMQQLLLRHSKQTDPFLRWLEVPSVEEILAGAKENPEGFLERYHALIKLEDQQ